MKKAKWKRKIGWIITCNLLIFMVITSCGIGSFLGPKPTPTITLTPTPLPTATPDAMAMALQTAEQAWKAHNVDGAIQQYTSILKEAGDATIRQTAFVKLEEIGLATLQQAESLDQQSGSHEDGIVACNTYKQAQAAYAPLLEASDRPGIDENVFYTRAAKVDVELMDCHLWYDEPYQSADVVIKAMLKNLDRYPESHLITDLYVPAITAAFTNMVGDLLYGRNDISQQVVLDTGQAINQKMGEVMVGGKKTSDQVNFDLANISLCSETPVSIPGVEVGTSSTKKIESCPIFGSGYELDGTDLRAANTSEIWFTLDTKYDYGDDLDCTGYRTDTGTNFYYTYSGKFDETYILRDAHNGQVIGTKTFYGTSPRCVFNTCSLNTFTNEATCSGGEGQASYDQDVFNEWINSIVR